MDYYLSLLTHGDSMPGWIIAGLVILLVIVAVVAIVVLVWAGVAQ